MEPSIVPAAVRTLDIFEAFKFAKRPLSLTELARAARIPVSSCQSLMRTLECKGFLHFLTAREAYPTRKLFDIASEIHNNDPITVHLSPALTTLRDETGETIMLSARQGNSVVRLLVIESDQTIRYTARAGDMKPIHRSSIGRVLLAQLSDEALSNWLETKPLLADPEYNSGAERQLRRQVAQAREQGYYATRGDNVPDVMAIAAPLRVGSVTFGVAIAGPLHRMQHKESGHVAKLFATLGDLERQYDTTLDRRPT
jgi:IclR family acetate operon transcriptional repressor